MELDPMNYMEGHSIDLLRIETDCIVLSVKQVPVGSPVLNTVLEFLSDAEINLEILTQTAPVRGKSELAFVLPQRNKADIERLICMLADLYPKAQALLNENITLLSLTGVGMRTQSGIAARFLNVFSSLDIPVLMITTSEIRVAAVIPEIHAPEAVKAVKSAFSL